MDIALDYFAGVIQHKGISNRTSFVKETLIMAPNRPSIGREAETHHGNDEAIHTFYPRRLVHVAQFS
jgi:hypothetical protein